MINYKMNSITADELLKYANQFHVQLNSEEAEKITTYLRGKHFDIFNNTERTKIIKEIAKIANPETAREINRLFIRFSQ